MVHLTNRERKIMSDNKEVLLGNEFSLDVNIGIDEVVSVFVSQYEDNLFERKKDLSKNIKELKKDVVNLEKKVLETVDVSIYNTTNDVLGIKSEVKKGYVNVSWIDGEITISIDITDLDNTSRYSNNMNKVRRLKVDSSSLLSYKELTEEIELLSGELMEVLSLIKSVSRKERQIRGKVSEMKLKESGYDNLLGNQEIMKLVQL